METERFCADGLRTTMVSYGVAVDVAVHDVPDEPPRPIVFPEVMTIERDAVPPMVSDAVIHVSSMTQSPKAKVHALPQVA